MDEATVSLAGVWEEILEPWLTGYGWPNWSKFIDTVRAIFPVGSGLDYDALKQRAETLDYDTDLLNWKAERQSPKNKRRPKKRRARRRKR